MAGRALFGFLSFKLTFIATECFKVINSSHVHKIYLDVTSGLVLNLDVRSGLVLNLNETPGLVLNLDKTSGPVLNVDVMSGLVLNLCRLLQLFCRTSAGLDSQQKVGNFYTELSILKVRHSKLNP